MLLTGNYARSIDEKLRVAIPKQVRQTLQLPDAALLYVAPGTDASLSIYTEEAFGKMAARLATSPPQQNDVRAYARLFYGLAQAVELDRQGRIRIPPELAQHAGLEKEAMLLGVYDHLELWDRERWNRYREEKASQYDTLAEGALGGTSAPASKPSNP